MATLDTLRIASPQSEEERLLEELHQVQGKKAEAIKLRDIADQASTVPLGEDISNDARELLRVEEHDALRKEAEKELKKMRAEELQKIDWGLSTIGFKIEKMKDDFLASRLDKGLKRIDPKGTVGRFGAELRDYFVRNSKEALKKANDLNAYKDTKILKVNVSAKNQRKLGNIGAISGNVLKYGRLLTDAFGLSPGGAQRVVMAAGMATAVLAEAGKEARFKNEELIADTRFGHTGMKLEDNPFAEDIARAQEEAMAIYNQALAKEGKEKGENISDVESLKRAYLMQMPRDLQKRLEEPVVATSAIQEIMAGQINLSLWLLDKKIQKIEADKKLDATQKETAKEGLLKRYEKQLNDYDRMVTKYGTVDALASAARNLQTLGKGTVLAMQIQSGAKLTRLVGEKIWEGVAHIFSSSSATADIRVHFQPRGHNIDLAKDVPPPTTPKINIPESGPKAPILETSHETPPTTAEDAVAADNVTPSPIPKPLPQTVQSTAEEFNSRSLGSPKGEVLTAEQTDLEASRVDLEGAKSRAEEAAKSLASAEEQATKLEQARQFDRDAMAKIREAVHANNPNQDYSAAAHTVETSTMTNEEGLAFMGKHDEMPSLKTDLPVTPSHETAIDLESVPPEPVGNPHAAVEAAREKVLSSFDAGASEHVVDQEIIPTPDVKIAAGLPSDVHTIIGTPASAPPAPPLLTEKEIRVGFGEHPYHFPEKMSGEVGKIYEDHVGKILDGRNPEMWNADLGRRSAQDFFTEHDTVGITTRHLKNTYYNGTFKFLQEVRKVTGLRPKGRGLFSWFRQETVEEYLVRALKYAEKNEGMLAKLKK